MNWHFLQNGIGIAWEGETLQAVCVKRQWNRVCVADRLEIAQARQSGPARCGSLYREFLRKNGLKAPWTVVALPRSAVLLRWLSFPRAVEKDVARAVEYQLESLHPFEEGSVYWDFSLWNLPERSWPRRRTDREEETQPEPLEVVVAIAQKEYVDEIARWFREAAIPVSQFTVNSALLFSMLEPRLLAVSKEPHAFFILDAGSETAELIGYAPGRGLVSREIPLAFGPAETAEDLRPILERDLAVARSELRLEPEARPPLVLCGRDLPLSSQDPSCALFSLEGLFPGMRVRAEGFRLREHGVAFAAALEAADRARRLSFNLLPPEHRSYQSPLEYLPAYGLSGLVVLLALALGLRGNVQDWLYGRYLEREIAALQPQLEEVDITQDQNRKTLERLAFLVGARNSAALPLEILNELTRLLPEDVWLQQMHYEGNNLILVGLARSASGLLQTLAASDYFENPQFMAALNRTPDGNENFRIAVRLRAPDR